MNSQIIPNDLHFEALKNIALKLYGYQYLCLGMYVAGLYQTLFQVLDLNFEHYFEASSKPLQHEGVLDYLQEKPSETHHCSTR